MAALLRARGHEPIISPLTEIRFSQGPDISLDGVQAILATSANGARALARRTTRRDVPVFAVGRHTAAAAEVAGFHIVKSADGDAARLAASVVEWATPEGGILLHAAGREHRTDLSLRIGNEGFRVRTQIVYEATECASLSEQALAALRCREIDAVLFFSPRSARLFAQRMQQERLSLAAANLTAVCISHAAAEALLPLTFSDVRIANRPDQEAVLQLLDC